MAITDSGDHPEITSLEALSLDDLENTLLRKAVAYWRSLCRDRRFPAWDDVDPRDLVPLRHHLIVLKVIDGGADFEYRVVGEMQRRAYVHPYVGRRISQPANRSPYNAWFFAGYQYIQKSGTPFALRGWAGKDFTDSTFAYFETLALPLGPNDGQVDHIMVFSAYAPRDLKPVLS
jgi:hypothetical protein